MEKMKLSTLGAVAAIGGMFSAPVDIAPAHLPRTYGDTRRGTKNKTQQHRRAKAMKVRKAIRLQRRKMKARA